MKKHENCKLVLCGHSLGASTSALVTKIWQDRFPDMLCYAFAPPAACSFDVAEALGSRVHSVINRNDVVPRFCTSTLMRLFFEAANFDAAVYAQAFLQKKFAKNEPQDDLVEANHPMAKLIRNFGIPEVDEDVGKDIMDNMLYIPGRLYYLDGDGGLRGDHQYGFSMIEPTKTFGNDHKMGNYLLHMEYVLGLKEKPVEAKGGCCSIN